MAKFNFNSQTTRFDLINALRLAEASVLVYQPKKVILETLEKKWKFSNKDYFDIQDTQVLIGANADFTLLAFRGTQSLKDWQTNINARLVKVRRGRVHRGFKRGLDFVWGNIRKAVFDFDSQKQRIWVTGHSLGGALAALAVDRLTDLGFDIGGLYTFGQPRVGDKTFSRQFDQKIKHRSWRFINNEDIVTRIPPRRFGYRHIGTPRYFDNDGLLHKDNINWKRFLDRLKSIQIRSLDRYKELRHQYPNGIEDHSMERYVRFIRKNLRKEDNRSAFARYLTIN